jgi:hypothetical protein
MHMGDGCRKKFGMKSNGLKSSLGVIMVDGKGEEGNFL